MTGFRFRKLNQQLAHGGVARRLRRLAIEALGLEFHVLGEFAHVIEPERTHQPQRRRLVLDEALHVLAADQRQIFAEFLAVEIEQHRAVVHFLFRHLVEYLGG